MSILRNKSCVPYFTSRVTRPNGACTFKKIAVSPCRIQRSMPIPLAHSVNHLHQVSTNPGASQYRSAELLHGNAGQQSVPWRSVWRRSRGRMVVVVVGGGGGTDSFRVLPNKMLQVTTHAFSRCSYLVWFLLLF